MSRAYSIVQALSMNALPAAYRAALTKDDTERMDLLDGMKDIHLDLREHNAEIFYADEDCAYEIDREEGWWLNKQKQWAPNEGVTRRWFGPFESIRDALDELIAVSK